MSTDISNRDRAIWRCDILERIEELEAIFYTKEELEAAAAELRTLNSLIEQLQASPAVWRADAVLIRDDCLADYARQRAKGAPGWQLFPINYPRVSCIEDEKAANELRESYMSVEFDGVTYWTSAIQPA